MTARNRVDDGGLDSVEYLCAAFRNGVSQGTQALAEFCSSEDHDQGTKISWKFIKATLEALRTGDWSEVGRAFVSQEFIWEDGRFLLIGPYESSRSGVSAVELTGIYGRVLDDAPEWNFDETFKNLFGETRRVAELIPFECVSAFGHADETQGEAFLVPDAWRIEGADGGPALNNMTAQQRRFNSFGRSCLSAIFAPPSAKLLMAGLATQDIASVVRHREFQFHEAGHATGLGLRSKLASGLLPTPWYRGIEEWRADGVEFELLTRMIGNEEAGKTIGANYCLRFGIDAHRRGGLERDTDVVASLLLLTSLLRGQALYIDRDRRLRFRDETLSGLVEASRVHREDALQLTRAEMKLSVDQGLWMLYGSTLVDATAKIVLDGLVREPCLEIHGGCLE